MNATKPTERRNRRLILAICTLFVVLAAGGYAARGILFGSTDPNAGFVVATVTRGDLEDVVTATGTLQPRDYVDVGAQVSGLLNRIHVEVGSTVAENDLLAEIDARVLASRVDATHAQLRNQRAQLVERNANLSLAESQYRRQKNLMAEDATTEESLQNAEAGLRAARAQIDALKAQIDQTESNLRADEANLEYARILAPMAGTVVSISARQGQTLNANQSAPTILRIADLSTMTVEAQVSEADVSRLRLGMDVWFTTLGSGGQRWEGKLRRIDPTPVVTNNVVLFNALFDVPNADRRLMTQMTAQVFFVVARAADTLTVPMAAVSGLTPARGVPGGGRGGRPAAEGAAPPAAKAPASGTRRASVRVIGADGSVTPRDVEIGVTSRIAAEITSGLAEGERVVAGNRTAGASGAQAAARPMPIR